MSTDLAKTESVEIAPATLFGTDDPEQVVASATKAAKALAKVVTDQKLAVKIQGRPHVRVEGWTLLGSMLGVFPVVAWTRKLENGWEARVEARTRVGEIVGAAEAECLRSEKTWATRDDYALRSMAQTRATSKALRAPLGFVMQLAGFDPTPLEEMPQKEKTKRTVIEEPKASIKQVALIDAAIEAFCEGSDTKRDALDARLLEVYRTNDPAELSPAEADELLEKLKGGGTG
jgi:hypothetical protein